MSDSKPEFPIKITFENGEVEYYQDVEDIELNLEEFDSELALDCRVEDVLGRNVALSVSLLNLERLELGLNPDVRNYVCFPRFTERKGRHF